MSWNPFKRAWGFWTNRKNRKAEGILRYRPRLEALEDRCLLAATITGIIPSFTPTTDGLAGNILVDGLNLSAKVTVYEVDSQEQWNTQFFAADANRKQHPEAHLIASLPSSIDSGIYFFTLHDATDSTLSPIFSTFIYSTNQQNSVSSWKTTPDPPVAGSEFELVVKGDEQFTNRAAIIIQGDHGDVGLNTVNQSVLTGVLSATVPPSVIGNRAGQHNFTVFDGSTYGVIIGTGSITLFNPRPTVTGFTGGNMTAGDSILTYSVIGTDFVSGATVLVNGDPRQTDFISDTELRVTLTADDVSGDNPNIAISVMNPNPSAGVSNVMNFTLAIPTPTIQNLDPASIPVGNGPFTLTITGTGFLPADAEVLLGATALASAVVTATSITVTVPGDLAASAATDTVTVVNASSAGDQTSNGGTFSVGDPAGILTSLSPASATAFTTNTSFAVFGSGFVQNHGVAGDPYSVVYWDGEPLDTGFINSGELVAWLPDSLLTDAGTADVTVVTPTSDGGSQTGGPLTFMVNNPASVIDITANTGTATYGQDFTLAITGNSFLPGAVLLFNGQTYETTFVDGNDLTAVIPAAQLPLPQGANSSVTFTLLNPGPSLGPSNVGSFVVQLPPLTLTGMLPDKVDAGNGTVTLIIKGSGFIPGVTQVGFGYGGVDSMNVVGSTLLTAVVDASSLQLGGTVPVTLSEPGSTTASLTFTIDNPRATLTALSPSYAPSYNSADMPYPDTPGSPVASVVINGQGFSSAWSTLQWTDGNGNPLPIEQSTVVSATEIDAILNLTLAPAGSSTIRVVNAGPGGGTSNPMTFTIGNPLPKIYDENQTVFDPPSVFAGETSFTLTVPGDDLQPGATLFWNGTPLPTTFVSATELTAQVPASYVALPGTVTISAMNPDGEAAPQSWPFEMQQASFNETTSVSPAVITPGSAGVTLTVNGDYFLPGAAVQWQANLQSAQSLATTYVSGQEVTAVVPAADLTQPTTAIISVVNSDGASSSRVAFVTVDYPAPVVSATVPASLPANSVASSDFITLTVTGQNFQSGDAIWVTQTGDPTLEYSSLVTIFDSSTQLRGLLYGSYFPVAGTLELYVKHEDAGGLRSTLFPVTITQPDAGGDFAFSADTYQANDNSSTATITVLRTGATTNAATVNYATSDGTATAGTNYKAVSGTLAFAAGQTQGTFTVPILDQQLYKNNETVNLTLSDATGDAGFVFPSTAVLTIDNTAPPPIISFKSATGSGPESQNANLLVTLSGATALPASVFFIIAGTGVAGTDYVSPAVPMLTFAPGQTSLSLPITLLNDSTVHANRTLQVTLAQPMNAQLGTIQTTTYTIIDNNPLPTVAFAKNSGSGPEPTKAKLPVVLSAKAHFPVTVNYAVTGGTATAGTDFNLAPGTLTIPAGKTTGTITLLVLNDKLYEPKAETIVVSLSNPGNAVLGSAAVFTFTIKETDPMPTVSFKQTKDSGKESQTPNLLVVLSGGSSLVTTVSFTIIGGTATAGKDYTLPAGTTVTIQPGKTSVALPITLINDGTVHPNRTLIVQLSNPSNAKLGKKTTETFTIIDDNG